MATFKNNRQLAITDALLMAIIVVLMLGVVTTNASSGVSGEATTPNALFEFVGVTTPAACPDVVETFLSLT